MRLSSPWIPLGGLIVLTLGYVLRGQALLSDEKNGGYRDVATVAMIYGALAVLAGWVTVRVLRWAYGSVQRRRRVDQ